LIDFIIDELGEKVEDRNHNFDSCCDESVATSDILEPST